MAALTQSDSQEVVSSLRESRLLPYYGVVLLLLSREVCLKRFTKFVKASLRSSAGRHCTSLSIVYMLSLATSFCVFCQNRSSRSVSSSQ